MVIDITSMDTPSLEGCLVMCAFSVSRIYKGELCMLTAAWQSTHIKVIRRYSAIQYLLLQGLSTILSCLAKSQKSSGTFLYNHLPQEKRRISSALQSS